MKDLGVDLSGLSGRRSLRLQHPPRPLLAVHGRRDRRLVSSCRSKQACCSRTPCFLAIVDLDESEPLDVAPPDIHHQISHSRNFPVPLDEWVDEEDEGEEPVTKVVS